MMTEEQLIETFVRQLQLKGQLGLRIVDWPDKKPGTSGEIDALIEGPGRRIALEHTNADSYPAQQADNFRFGVALERLEADFKGQITSHITLTVEANAVPTGVKWEDIYQTLRAWLSANWAVLPPGRARYDVAGVPFPIEIDKDSDPGRPHGIYPQRYAPPDNEETDQLAARWAPQLARKATKVAKYKDRGYTTVVLVTTEDVGLMSLGKMRASVRQAFSNGRPAGVDEIWCMDASVPTAIQCGEVTWDSRTSKTNETNCPHCRRRIAIQHIEDDGKGYFTTCSNCQQQIDLVVRRNGPGAGVNFGISSVEE